MAKHNLKLKTFSLSLSKKAKRPRKLVKDKAIVNFLLEHMKPVKINFSKIKIPSFLNFTENEKRTPLIQIFSKRKITKMEVQLKEFHYLIIFMIM